MKKRQMAAVLMVTAVCMAAAGCKDQTAKDAEIQTEETVTEETVTDVQTEEEADTSPSSIDGKDTSGAEETEDPAKAEYIFPESDTRLLTSEELKAVPTDQLRFARNEIFARRGRMFTSAEFQEYFEAKSWYEGKIRPEDFSDSMLSEIEKKNISLIKAREDMGDILDTAETYKKIMDENEILDSSGLLEYGYITASMSGSYTEYYPVLEDKGSYYEVKDQRLSIPIYFEWDYIKNVKPGDTMTFSFGWDEEAVYTVTDILQEHGKDARVISVSSPKDTWETYLVFTDVFENGKYALAIVDDLYEGGYNIWNSDDICCACKTLYKGSFYLSKDCVIDVGGQMRSVEDQRETDWEKNPFGGAIYGYIEKVDENGIITRIRQQIAG